QREILRLQPCIHIVGKPPRIAKLERGTRAGRQRLEKSIEHDEVLLKIRRQLKQDRPELRAARRGHLEEIRRRVHAIAQAGEMRDALRRLQGEPEAFGRRAAPALHRLLIRHAVEGVVDLDAREARRVVRQHLRRLHLFGIEAALPLRIVPAGCADPDGHDARACVHSARRVLTRRRYCPRCRIACCGWPSDSYSRARLKWQSASVGSWLTAALYTSTACAVRPRSSSSTPRLKRSIGSGPQRSSAPR